MSFLDTSARRKRQPRNHVTIAENPHAHHTDGPVDEDAFRRGFQQGVEIALRGIASGVAAHRLERWRMAIFRWRFMRTHKQRIEPPCI
jgi:hypothetical protein